jgi:Zn-dependent membrane protease YugP
VVVRDVPVASRNLLETVLGVASSTAANEVAIEKVPGLLTDHYDPRTRVLNLSEGVYDSASIAAMSCASDR